MYPVFLAASSFTGGAFSEERLRLAQAALALLLAALACGLGACLHSPWAGLAAAAVVGFHPAFLAWENWAGVEVLFALCTTAAAAGLVGWARGRTPRRTLALGATLGASLWCRSTLVLLPALLLLARPRAKPWGLALAYALLLPWLGRNLYQFGAWIPLDSHGETPNLFVGSLGAREGMGDAESSRLAEARIPGWKELDYRQQDAAMRKAALGNILRSPLSYLGSCLSRLAVLWKSDWPLLTLGLAGAWRLRRRPEAAALGLLCLYFNIHALMGVDRRYVLPVLPTLAALAGAFAASAAGLAARPWPDRGALRLWLGAAALPCALACLSLLALAYETLAGPPQGAGPVPACAGAEGRPWPWAEPALRDAKRAQDRGVILYLAGRGGEAQRCFRAAIRLAPRYAAPRLSLAAVLAGKGLRDEARREQEAAERILAEAGDKEMLERVRPQRSASAVSL